MTSDLTWMLAMNDKARAFGDGLKPELENLLLREMRQAQQGLEVLNTRSVSSGPKHQFATQEELKAGSIPVLTSYRRQQTEVAQSQTSNKQHQSRDCEKPRES